MAITKKTTVLKHYVEINKNNLSFMQQTILDVPLDKENILLVSAPTGAGKSYIFEKIVREKGKVLFVVPTRRLAENLNATFLKTIPSKTRLFTGKELEKLEKEEKEEIKQQRRTDLDAFQGIIICTPETLSFLLMNLSRKGKGVNNVNALKIPFKFDYIVFDEAHLMDARWFAMSAFFVRLISENFITNNEEVFLNIRNTKVVFLSATPTKLSDVLEKIDIDPNKIISIKEKILQSNEITEKKVRALHGDVELEIHDEIDMISLVKNNIHLIKSTLAKKEKVLIIMDSLKELQKQKESFINLLQNLGGLAFDSSIDQQNSKTDPLKADIVISTSTFEQGLTIDKLTLAFIEPGLKPMNFLQRFGRVSRGNLDGKVLLRLPEESNLTLYSSFKLMPSYIDVESFYNALGIQDGNAVHFGEVSGNIQNLASLYHLSLERSLMDYKGKDKKSQLKIFWPTDASKLLRSIRIKNACAISAKIWNIYNLVKDDDINSMMFDKWVNSLYFESIKIRSIGDSIKVKYNDEIKNISLEWAQKHTYILEEGINYAEENLYEIRKPINEMLRTKSQFSFQKIALNPFAGTDQIIIQKGSDESEISQWISHMKRKGEASKRNQEIYKNIVGLVQMTSIFPWDESNVSNQADTVIL